MTRQDHDMLCACGHKRGAHFGKNHEGDCSEPTGLTTFCICKRFREGQFKNEEEIEMAKKKSASKEKDEGRKPVLAEFIDEGLNIYATYQGKEFEARVRKDGVIVFKDKEYATPNAAANAACADRKEGKKPFKVNGWLFWRFNKDGSRVALNVLRGSKSPLKDQPAKPKREKKAAASKSAKPPRKPRASTKKANGTSATKQDVSDRDIPQNEQPQAGV